MNGMVKIGLLPRIIIGIAVGIGVGYVAPMWVARICATFNAVFGQFLGFLIPLIIVGFVAPAIADLGKRAGGMLLFTAALAYAATFIAGVSSYFTGAWLFPSMISPEAMPAAVADAAVEITPYFSMDIPALMPALMIVFTSWISTLFSTSSCFVRLRYISEFSLITSVAVFTPPPSNL